MKTEQKNRGQYGDYLTLGEMLNVSSDAARMRYRRGDKEALAAMKVIKENRKALIENYKKQAI